MFDVDDKCQSPKHEKIDTAYELAYTIVDFSAGMLFLVGSGLFFYKQFEKPAIWCFVAGSVLFVLKSTLRLARELHYLAIGKVQPVARSLGVGTLACWMHSMP